MAELDGLDREAEVVGVWEDEGAPVTVAGGDEEGGGGATGVALGVSDGDPVAAAAPTAVPVPVAVVPAAVAVAVAVADNVCDAELDTEGCVLADTESSSVVPEGDVEGRAVCDADTEGSSVVPDGDVEGRGAVADTDDVSDRVGLTERVGELPSDAVFEGEGGTITYGGGVGPRQLLMTT